MLRVHVDEIVADAVRVRSVSKNRWHNSDDEKKLKEYRELLMAKRNKEARRQRSKSRDNFIDSKEEEKREILGLQKEMRASDERWKRVSSRRSTQRKGVKLWEVLRVHQKINVAGNLLFFSGAAEAICLTR